MCFLQKQIDLFETTKNHSAASSLKLIWILLTANKIEKNLYIVQKPFLNKIMNLKNIIWNSKYMVTDQ